MFGHRSDGKQLKHVSPEFKVIPNIMRERDDSQVFFNQDVAIDSITEYIDRKAKEGEKITLMEVVFAAVLRIVAERPKLNRFAMNGRIYARNNISLSLTVKKSLSDDADESNLKFYFDGTETIYEVRDIIQKELEKNKHTDEDVSGTDKTAEKLTSIPYGLVKFVLSILYFMDRRGHLPKKLIKVSPFHTSAYITNVGSLGINSIYHHLYNFGTTSMFFAIGKKKKALVSEDDEIKEERCVNLAFVGDERICDGYYYANSFRKLCRYLAKPELLEQPGKREPDPEL